MGTSVTKEAAYNVDCVVGKRPNFVKIAPVIRALQSRPGIATRLIHTGQHYDFLMDAVFFDQLGIPAPDINLGVGSGRSASQVARIMLAVDAIFAARPPDLLIVVGDVNSTLAAALAAAKMAIPVAHVEAGLRSFDRAMPEELNRIVVDRLADLHFVSEPSGIGNLARENIGPDRVHFVGNVMIDTLLANLGRAIPPARTFADIDASAAFRQAARAAGYVFATLHRPSNVDDAARLEACLRAFVRIAQLVQ